MSTVSLDNVLKSEKGSLLRQAQIVLYLSIPAILAQFTSIAMQYIDTAMVGSLGKEATASIGLVSTSTWLIGGTSIGLTSGFSVQVAHLIGAQENKKASDVLRQSLLLLLTIGIIISLIGVSISGKLPIWLGGDKELIKDASTYFLIYCLTVPVSLIRHLCASMMQASGDMKTPSILSTTVCFLDVIFNMFFIFPARTVKLLGTEIYIPGAGLKVMGAALGTSVSEVIVAGLMIYFLCFKNRKISLKNKGSWAIQKMVILRALKIAVPVCLDQIFTCSAYVMATKIVAPLGTVALAANTLAITAESLCYMPGYGVASASTAIIGQTIGARRSDLTKSFSRICVYLGVLMMSAMAVLMFIISPFVMAMLNRNGDVVNLATSVIRIELFAEPLYAASICCAGVFRGAGDTLLPSLMNLVSMWGVRILLALILIPYLGLTGYWLAMAIELAFRGLIFMFRLYRGKWEKKEAFI